MATPFNLGDDDLLSPTFWEGIGQGEFRVQRCQSCGRARFPPTSFCPDCHAVDFRWEPASGRARVWSYTVVHRAPTAELAGEVPYTLVVGQLREGPLVLARLLQVEPAPVTIGIPIVLRFHTDAAGFARYHFVADSSADQGYSTEP
jgi:uncharacterized OB-fold protein